MALGYCDGLFAVYEGRCLCQSNVSAAEAALLYSLNMQDGLSRNHSKDWKHEVSVLR